MVVVLFNVPDVPDTVTVDAPAAAELFDVNVRVLLLVVLAGLNEALTPAGIPDTISATAPVNPLSGVTEIVLLPPAPGLIVIAA